MSTAPNTLQACRVRIRGSQVCLWRHGSHAVANPPGVLDQKMQVCLPKPLRHPMTHKKLTQGQLEVALLEVFFV